MPATEAETLPSFEQIEARREQLGISQAALCRRAEIDPVTYSRRKAAGRAQPGTRQKLKDALDTFESAAASEAAE